ncbi:MAG: hypothetical protein J1E98_03515 [Lachnospiraceae bacterium]|nr:hypothetical protein [Lachnospiraceae bacterium]
MDKKTNGQLKWFIPMLAIIPFIIGTIGYVRAEESLSDSLYYSLSLYFVNLNSESSNIMIDIARWTAAMVTAATVLYILKQIWEKILRTVISLRSDSVAVYNDNGKKIFFDDKSHAVIYPGRTICPRAKNHIIMMNTDTDSIKFYNENKARFRNKKIYIGLLEIEYGLMKDVPDVTFYDIGGAIARTLWKSISLWNNRGKTESLIITIMGSGHLGQNILNHGLLLNLFSAHQSITYNLIGSTKLYQVAHDEIETCNQDSVHFYSPDDDDIWDVIKQSNIVILTEQISFEKLQTIGTVCKDGQIFYYEPGEEDICRYIKLNHLIPYGRDCEIYTDENIRKDHLIKQAMDLNYDYVQHYGNEASDTTPKKEWDKLDGFLKWSNISSADFIEIMKAIAGFDYDVSEDELAELEHIRWCRFHYLNYWKYGIPDNGKNRDEKKKIHKCLRAYTDLSEADREKNREIVRNALIRETAP